MILTIFDHAGNPKCDVSPEDTSTQVSEIQGDNVLTLSFVHHDHIPLDVDDYVDFEGARYWLTEKYRPVQKSTKEWIYDLKLYGIESLLRNFLVIKRVDGEDDPVFTLTAPPREHVSMIVNCMNDGAGHIADWKVGTVVGNENVVIDYHGKYCDEALREIADKVGAEWWIEGQTVNVCRCEHGEPIVLGYDNGLTGIDPDRVDNVKFYTRLYPVGSSRNIDPGSYGASRLQLPGGRKYVEINADKYSRVDHYEKDAFAGIYPRRIGFVSSVRSEEKTGNDGERFTVYHFRDKDLPFDPNDYLMGGVMRVSFQEGSELGGLGQEENGTYYLEVNFDSEKKEFEIITIWPYDNDIQLPGGVFVPNVGDGYILWNIRMPEEYYRLAEQELLTAVNGYNAQHGLDVSVFKGRTDHVWIEENEVSLAVGQRVRLESERYFPGLGYRDSRITKITRKVNLPSSMDIEISDALSQSARQSISDKINGVRNYASSIRNSIALPDLIRTGDRTLPTDNNIFSARRSQQEFLSRVADDVARGRITFKEGLTAIGLAIFRGGAQFGEFIKSLHAGRGAGVDAQGNAEFESVRVRTYFEAAEYVINRLEVVEGDRLLTEGDTVESVVNLGKGVYGLYLRRKWEGYVTAQKRNNVLKGILNTLTSGSGVYITSWMRVNRVDAAANYIEVSMYPDAQVPSGQNFSPRELMKIARWGNQTDPSRQSCLYLSSTEGRIVKLSGVTAPIIDRSNYGAVFGSVPEFLKEMDLPLVEGQDYLYARGLIVEDIIRVDYQGKPVVTYVDRGVWREGAAYYHEERNPQTGVFETSDVWYLGCRYRCMLTGVVTPPVWNDTAWAMIEGAPDFTVELTGAEEALDPEILDVTLKVVARLYNADVTEDVCDADVEWSRYSEDGSGTPRHSLDGAWTSRRGAAGKTLRLTREDMDFDGTLPRVMRFTATVALRDRSGRVLARQHGGK